MSTYRSKPKNPPAATDDDGVPVFTFGDADKAAGLSEEQAFDFWSSKLTLREYHAPT